MPPYEGSTAVQCDEDMTLLSHLQPPCPPSTTQPTAAQGLVARQLAADLLALEQDFQGFNAVGGGWTTYHSSTLHCVCTSLHTASLSSFFFFFCVYHYERPSHPSPVSTVMHRHASRALMTAEGPAAPYTAPTAPLLRPSRGIVDGTLFCM